MPLWKFIVTSWLYIAHKQVNESVKAKETPKGCAIVVTIILLIILGILFLWKEGLNAIS